MLKGKVQMAEMRQNGQEHTTETDIVTHSAVVLNIKQGSVGYNNKTTYTPKHQQSPSTL